MDFEACVIPGLRALALSGFAGGGFGFVTAGFVTAGCVTAGFVPAGLDIDLARMFLGIVGAGVSSFGSDLARMFLGIVGAGVSNSARPLTPESEKNKKKYIYIYIHVYMHMYVHMYIARVCTLHHMKCRPRRARATSSSTVASLGVFFGFNLEERLDPEPTYSEVR